MPPMFRSCSQLNMRRRATAWLLLLLCAWMGTGGVLHHSDAEIIAQRAANLAPRLPHPAFGPFVPVPSDACAACEWTQGLQGRTLSVCRIDFPLFFLPSRRAASLPVLLAQTPCHRPSRAPPVFPA